MSAADHWSAQLGEWGIPDEILAQAPISPWSHDVAMFSVDDTLDRDGMSARVAREVLPLNGGVVLDVGCGGGRSSAVLVPPAETLIGVDANATMLAAFEDAARALGVAAQTVHGRVARRRAGDPGRRRRRLPPRVLQRRRRRPVRNSRSPSTPGWRSWSRFPSGIRCQAGTRRSSTSGTSTGRWARPMPISSPCCARQGWTPRSGTATGHRCRAIPAIPSTLLPRRAPAAVPPPGPRRRTGRLSRRQSDRLRRDRRHVAMARHGDAAGVTNDASDDPLNRRTARRPLWESSARPCRGRQRRCSARRPCR